MGLDDHLNVWVLPSSSQPGSCNRLCFEVMLRARMGIGVCLGDWKPLLPFPSGSCSCFRIGISPRIRMRPGDRLSDWMPSNFSHLGIKVVSEAEFFLMPFGQLKLPTTGFRSCFRQGLPVWNPNLYDSQHLLVVYIQGPEVGVRRNQSATSAFAQATFDPGDSAAFACKRFMASTGDGGDKGATDKEATRPKSPGGGAIILTRMQDDLALIRNTPVTMDSHWDSGSAHGCNVGPEARLEGEVDMEDDDVLEIEEDEDNGLQDDLWKLLARYYAQQKPNAKAMFEQLSSVWQLRYGIKYVPLENNLFIITLYSEGDFNFVARGGPWIHRGNALLVTPFNGAARPSETMLDSVPVWVRIYDVPWGWQTDAMARKLGSKLGKVKEVDLGDDGKGLNEFLRVRVNIPLDRRLQTKIYVKIKGKAENSSFLLQYERVPFFCFHCGFIGHSEVKCEKKRLGVPSMHYSSDLRCSPFRKFEHRSGRVDPSMQVPRARRGLNFDPPGSVDSSNRRRRRDVQRHQESKQNMSNNTYENVGARDDFEAEETPGDSQHVLDLATRVTSMRMHLRKEKPECSKQRAGDDTNFPRNPGLGTTFQLFGKDIICTNPLFGNQADALQPIQPAEEEAQPSEMDKSLGSSDIIPVLRFLPSALESQGDSEMPDVSNMGDSRLGKRTAEQQEEPVLENVNSLALVVHQKAVQGGARKKGRMQQDIQIGGDVQDQREDAMDGLVEKEATSSGAAGKLTGPSVAPRQEQ